MKIYEEQKIRIRLNNAVTDYFTISNDVKQGGVLSLILFSLYLDQFIPQLRHLSMNCNIINGLFTGVFIYADDMTLRAPLRASLAFMLEQCESFSRTDILFNAWKTKYMIFKCREIVNVAPLYFKGSPINFVHECDLLGITLSSNRTTGSYEILH